jgi:signal transduction histidine kinase
MDVTRQKQLEQDAQGLSERRRELLGTQREFISMVSHEFRTPLTTIEGAQYLLERLLYESAGLNAAVAANVSKWFGLQASALATLRKLVDQVLMLNRTEHVTGEASLELLSPGDVLREAVAGFNDSMDTPRVTLVDGTPAGYAASMDPGLVKAAAENLISNGLKYSRPDSVVGVRVFAEPGGWVLEVADGGRGIPSEDQAKLFRPFFRAGNVGAVPGTGLGLAIVQRAVDFHTGRIEFESGENSGTRFTLHLPMCPHPLVDGGPPTRESPLGSE